MNPDLLARLVCPVTRAPLRWDEERRELISEAAGLAYPVREGVPVMLVEEARILEP
ncbi:MAG: Trm112 family protein [Allosphingosinicella sp.]